MTLRGLTERQDQRIGRVVRRVEALLPDERPRGGVGFAPFLARVLATTEVWNRRVGRCNPLIGTGNKLQSILRPGIPSGLGGEPALDFIQPDLTREFKFLNLTGGIVTQEDILVIIRITVPKSGSDDAENELLPFLAQPGGALCAINGQNNMHFGITSGIIPPGGFGNVSPSTETSIFGQQTPVGLFAAHGGEDISTNKQIIYHRRGEDRMVIAAECETPASPVPGVPGYINPNPPDKAVVVSTTPTLSWQGGAGLDDLFFGQPGQIIQIAQGLVVDSFEFGGPLQENTVYQWLVKSKSVLTGEERLSPLWTFSTGPQVPFRSTLVARAQLTSTLAGGAVPFASNLTARATVTARPAGGIVSLVPSGGTLTARAVVTANLTKF